MLSKVRGLVSADGLNEMQTAGCLAFSDDLSDMDADGEWHRVAAWLALDSTRRNVSARRLDGLHWNCCRGAKSRCLSGAGSKGWPVGLTVAKAGQRLDVVEGEGDFLAMWHLHALAREENAAPVGLLGACANFETYAPEIAPHIANRTVQIFVHRDGNGAGQAASKLWAAAFYRLGAAIVRARDLTAWLDGRGKDLNDALIADASRRRAGAPVGFCPACFARNVVAPLRGPTCPCTEFRWPIFNSKQFIAETTCA